MLSSLFESRNSASKVVENKQLFDLTTKKVDLPKPIIKQPEQIQGSQQQKSNDKKKPKEIIQKDRPEATIFVGNVHLETKHNQLKNLFSKYGKVQKIWFRSIPVEANKMGRKASHLLKKYIEGANVMNAYVRFENQQSVEEACKENGSQFKQLTLRVTPCQQKDNDTESTIFVGNLSHDIQEQQLRDHFSGIGKIISVRVIKSRQTNKGIGIGYVHFSTKQQMKEAIQKLNNTKLLDRDIRVKKAIAQDRLQKKTKKIQEKYGKKFKPSKKQQVNKNQKAIEIRKKAQEIKMKRQQNKTKQIKK